MQKSVFAVFLRAVNLGGKSTVKMADLRALCSELKFEFVQTYIASGNVILVTTMDRSQLKQTLEFALENRFGQPIPVFVKTPQELRGILACNPFSDAPGNKVLCLLLDQAPDSTAINKVTGIKKEELTTGPDCVFIHFPDGQGNSRLRFRLMDEGTARNMNTIQKVFDLTQTVINLRDSH